VTSVGLVWHSAQSNAASFVVPGTPFSHATASCRISPLGGVRVGAVAVGPTKPDGSEAVWQSLHSAGWGSDRLASAECSVPG
jgi:hypothetical protein